MAKGLFFLAVAALCALCAARADATSAQDCAVLSDTVDLAKCGVVLKQPGQGESTIGSADADLLAVMRVSTKVKSYALIISVSDYPLLNIPKLQAADVDFDNLSRFFSKVQGFDVVMGLRDGMVTEHNIKYLLKTVNSNASLLKNSRLVVAITGHGFDDRGGSYLVLSAADQGRGDTSEGKALSLRGLRQTLNEIQSDFFHVLLLVNVCQGNDLFSAALSGDNANVPSWRSVRAITSGSNSDIVFASPDRQPAGSVFFDGIIEGVVSGNADPEELQVITDAQGSRQEYKGFVRFGSLVSYLSKRAEELTKAGTHQYSYPFQGSILDIAPGVPTTLPDAAIGGAFFMVPLTAIAEVTAQTSLPGPVAIPTGPVSAVRGRPDLKVFNPIDQYPVHGLNLSSYSGEPAQSLERAAGPVDFVYARAANGVTGEADSRFFSNLRAFEDRPSGAYYVLSYCAPLKDQIELLQKVVPVRADALPIAVDAEFHAAVPKPGAFGDESACGAGMGDVNRKEWAADFAESVRSIYGKAPIIYGNPEFFAGERLERLDKFAIWFADDSRKGVTTNLPGRNPWTIWQYAPTGYLRNTKTEAGRSVFFGTREQFRAFAESGRNEALNAALRE